MDLADAPRLLETVAERLRRESAWRDPDEAASAGVPLEARLATLRHLWYCECAAQPRVDDTAANMCRALEKAARVVEAAGARGSALHDALGDAARAMQGSAADRRARHHTAFESVRRVLAVDLPPPPQLADGGEAAEKRERAALQAALVVVLRRLVAIVVLAEGEWRDAAAREVRLRAGREDRREWLRLVVRSWRECVDGRRAGAARWAARWREGNVGALARRNVDAIEWCVGQYPTLMLEYARLVRGGIIAATRQMRGTRELAAAAAERFARGFKRAWAGERSDNHAASLESWVESAGTRTLQRGGLRVVEIFARHGPPAAAHSAAAAAKEQTETGRRQVVRYGHEQADTARVAGKRPAGGRQPARPAPSTRKTAGPEGGGGGSGAAADTGGGNARDGASDGSPPHESAVATGGERTRGAAGPSDGGVAQAGDGNGAGCSGERVHHGGGSAGGDDAVTGAGDTDGGGRRDGGRSGARQRRRVGTGGAMAVKRFAAFAAGESVDDVDMVGGVHVLAGAKRAPGELAERLMRQRNERGERIERRERQRGMADTGSAGGTIEACGGGASAWTPWR